jgi:thioredoxin reductase (NADPH)
MRCNRTMSERVADLPDTDDPVLNPRLDLDQLRRIKAAGRFTFFEPGQTLYEQGRRNAPFYVLKSGRVEFVEHRIDGDRLLGACPPRTFIGDLAHFTGEPTLTDCVATERSEVLELTTEELRRLVAGDPNLGDLILATMIARREWAEGHGYGQIRLLGSRFSRPAFELREFMGRNRAPFTWIDLETDPAGRTLLDRLGLLEDELPVLIGPHGVFRNPPIDKVAVKFGLRATVGTEPYDLAVLGAGPAGLAAAVYGASEGLRTAVVEAYAPGGQAGTSSRIENYLGFPTGVSGAELTRRATLQARRFGAVLSSSHQATRLLAGPDGLQQVQLGDGQRLLARAVVVATGADYRRLPAEGVERFEGTGVYYSATFAEAMACAGEEVVVVGGGNSAGQAAMHLAEHASRVRLLVRGASLASSMSAYLADRIAASGRVELLTHTELRAFHGDGDGQLDSVSVTDRRDESSRDVPARAVFVMIGAVPRTEAVSSTVGLDRTGFVVTGSKAAEHPDFAASWDSGGIKRAPFLLETTRQGVFAAGDVRSGSTKRVASAVGEGAMAVRYVQEDLASR